MKPTFKFPKTKMCMVIWYRNNISHETLIDTPFNHDDLFYTMLMKHHVGYSEIRALLAVDPKQLIRAFGRNA